MPRPALSASRSLDILDLLAAFPYRAFTLTEIAQACKINIASCHAVLSVLVKRGYLIRLANGRSYQLGAVPIAIGQAALASQSLIAQTKDAAQELNRVLGIPVIVTGLLGDEIIGLASFKDQAGRDAGMRVAERRPFVAPLGAPLVAWDTKDAIDAWIARNALPKDEQRDGQWRHILELTRQRGYQVSLRARNGPDIGAVLAEMATGHGVADYKQGMFQLFNALDHELDQPEDLEDGQLYDIVLIAAPVFDRSGKAVLSVAIGGFVDRLTGAQIKDYSGRLLRACLEIVRADRAQR